MFHRYMSCVFTYCQSTIEHFGYGAQQIHDNDDGSDDDDDDDDNVFLSVVLCS